jgi:hypothetical protein
MKTYDTTSTSRNTATVKDIELSTTATTRKVVRSELVDNAKDPAASVKLTLVHQRKGPNDQWEDIPADGFNKLKAGDTAKFPLDSADTLELYKQLKALYSIYDGKQIPWGDASLVVGYPYEIVRVDSQRAAIVQTLVNQGHGIEVWKELLKANSDLATRLSHAQIQSERAAALVEFEEAMGKDLGEREYWDPFFQRNLWIFGYGLKYQFLSSVEEQANYGGANVSGQGAQRGDNLMASQAEIRFTVLVEIKSPAAKLLADRPHRSGTYAPSRDLTEAVSQVQVNANQWEVEGSRTDGNRERLTESGIHTVAPHGVLVIGHTGELDSGDKRRSFELYRQNVRCPDVVTFDELFERARFIVGHAQQEST